MLEHGAAHRFRGRLALPSAPRPQPDRRRALELLAGCPDGCTDALMFANGFTAEQLLDLVHAGLATAHAERMVADERTIELGRVTITEAGRRALAGTRHG